VILVGLLTAFILLDVLGTVFFAVTVAYAFTPVYRWLRRQGLPAWWASAVTTAVTFVGVVALFLPIAGVVYFRRHDLMALFGELPDAVTLSVVDYTVTVGIVDIVEPASTYLRGLALGLAQTTLVLLIKLGLFAIVLFGLFIAQRDAHQAVLAVVPDGYHDVVAALEGRARATLYAIYVLQALTGFATFLIALPVFFALGYEFPFSLAVIAGLLQFAPIVGPSVLVGGIAVYHLAVGQLDAAVLVVLVAGTLVAWLPDLIVRPRFARRTANLPGSLYFIGFTGGVFGLGPIGIVAGPLVVALFVESVSLLADHRRDAGHVEDLGAGAGTETGTDDGPEAVADSTSESPLADRESRTGEWTDSGEREDDERP